MTPPVVPQVELEHSSPYTRTLQQATKVSFSGTFRPRAVGVSHRSPGSETQWRKTVVLGPSIVDRLNTIICPADPVPRPFTTRPTRCEYPPPPEPAAEPEETDTYLERLKQIAVEIATKETADNQSSPLLLDVRPAELPLPSPSMLSSSACRLDGPFLPASQTAIQDRSVHPSRCIHI